MLPYIRIATANLPTFPFVILAALFATALVYIKSAKYEKLFIVDVMKKTIPVLVGAAIGAKFISAISLLPIAHSISWSRLLLGGSVFYGGIIGGSVSLAIICAIKKQPFLEYTDVFASLLPLGHAIGRFGCYLNGCCYGCIYDGFLSVNYPVNGEMVCVFPTWFTEATVCVLLFVFFQCVLKTEIRGIRTAIYFISYSIYRFFVEFVRGDEIRGYWGVLSTSQVISILTFVFGLIVLVYSLKTRMFNYLFTKENKDCEI